MLQGSQAPLMARYVKIMSHYMYPILVHVYLTHCPLDHLPDLTSIPVSPRAVSHTSSLLKSWSKQHLL